MITQFAMDDPGYVLVSRKPWVAETSLMVFLVILSLAFLAFYLLIRLGVRIWHTPAGFRSWRRQQQTSRARQSLAQGIIHLLQEEWKDGHKQLLADLKNCDTPLINYLGAAIAAQHLGDTEKRDHYLALAHKQAPKESLVIGLIQAQLQIDSKQYIHAHATLGQLHASAPRNHRVLKLLVRVNRELRDWSGLAALLPSLRKQEIFDEESLAELERLTCEKLLAQASAAHDPKLLSRLWEETLPRYLRDSLDCIAIYARCLLELKAMDQCEELLRHTIRRRWDTRLVKLYGLAEAGDPVAQLRVAEGWLEAHPYSPSLLICVGRLAIRNQLWGKARSYLESAISDAGPPEALLELGQLLTHLGEADKAAEYFRRGLELSAAAGDDSPANTRESRPLADKSSSVA
jgi:HemY protein